MPTRAIANINSIWDRVAEGQPYRTPDNAKGASFTIVHLAPDFITIRTAGKPARNILGSNVDITRTSFVAALEYLYTHLHSVDNPCDIASNNTTRLAGPLCVAGRTPNGNTRCINYILPILKHFNLVGIDGRRTQAHPLNSTWYI